MTIPHRPFDVIRLTRRELLKAGGLALGGLSVGAPALYGFEGAWLDKA